GRSGGGLGVCGRWPGERPARGVGPRRSSVGCGSRCFHGGGGRFASSFYEPESISGLVYQTREVQFDEKWAFVSTKQKNCDPTNPAEDHRGDWWDHVAYDPEHKLVLAVVPGARVTESVVAVVAEVKDRLGDQPPALVTSDEYPAYESVIA